VDDSLGEAEDDPGDEHPSAEHHQRGARPVRARRSSGQPERTGEENERTWNEPRDVAAERFAEQAG
jgi:hypothetical protein